jgi:hypothetical protein
MGTAFGLGGLWGTRKGFTSTEPDKRLSTPWRIGIPLGLAAFGFGVGPSLLRFGSRIGANRAVRPLF